MSREFFAHHFLLMSLRSWFTAAIALDESDTENLIICMQWPFKNTSNSYRVPVYKAYFYYVNCNKPPPGKQK